MFRVITACCLDVKIKIKMSHNFAAVGIGATGTNLFLLLPSTVPGRVPRYPFTAR